jgi:hypothetical protein
MAIGAVAAEGDLTSSGAMSWGISPCNRIEKKQRQAYETRFPRFIIMTPMPNGEDQGDIPDDKLYHLLLPAG